MIELIGYIGAIAFTLCGWPMAYESWKDQCAKKINNWFLAMWSIGDIALLIYNIAHHHTPLIIDYTLNAFFVAYIYYIKYKYRDGREGTN